MDLRGSVYDGSSWKSIDTEDAYKQKNLFYWLHQDGFYGETQLNQARNLVEDDTLSNKVSDIKIENTKADSQYLYTPYETADLPAGYEGETPLTDSTLKAKGFFGQRNYSFQTNGNLVKDFTVLGARIYQTLAQGDDTAYREDESYYNTLCTVRTQSFRLHWRHYSEKNWETVETGSRDIPIIILQSPESVHIWKKI